MINNVFGWCVGKLMPASLHSWFSKRSRWMFAAVWIRAEQRHKSMWVDRERYYSGELQSI